MAVTLQQLKAFNALARVGGLTLAARRLNTSEAAVASDLRCLEADHGVALFEMRGHRQVLTEMGRRLFRVSKTLDDMEYAASLLLNGEDEVLPQTLRIATASPQVFMPVVAAFRDRHPAVDLDVFVGTTGDAMRRLMDRDADVALTPVPEPEERLESFVYLSHGLAALMPVDHPMAQQEAVTLSEAAAHPLISRRGLSTTQRTADLALAMHGLHPVPVLRLETREAVHEAVANGLGLSLVLTDDVPPDRRFRAVPLRDVHVQADESVVWLRSRRSSPLIGDFITVAETMAGARSGRGQRLASD